MLECLGDTDFLAKLHCIRQACQVLKRFLQLRHSWASSKSLKAVTAMLFEVLDLKYRCFYLQVILHERATRMFLADTGKKILSSIIVKARKVSGFLSF